MMNSLRKNIIIRVYHWIKFRDIIISNNNSVNGWREIIININNLFYSLQKSYSELI
jgi:hypothetical protein